MEQIGIAHMASFRQAYLEHSPKNCNRFHQGQKMRIILEIPQLTTRDTTHNYNTMPILSRWNTNAW